MSDTPESAIVVKDLYKSFRLPHEKHSGLKQAALSIFNTKRGFEKQEVLKDISFEIKKGEFFGIVGRNGSGKSTLLKLLAGIYTPDKGVVSVKGSLTPFIELGVGFNPELTGRENVFLNGALLGFSRSEMEEMYEDIVEFAELRKFMDQKLKNYSSGMQVRLAFSIAIRADTDILILDEVLAVGDEAFQRKCNDYFEQQKAKQQTIVLVTHDMKNVQKYCTRAMLIEEGKITKIGDPELVAMQYAKLNKTQNPADDRAMNTADIRVQFHDSNNKPADTFLVGDKIDIRLHWKNKATSAAGVVLYKQTGERMFAANTRMDKYKLTGDNCSYQLTLNVAPGKYYMRVRTYDDRDETIALVERTNPIVVEQKPGQNIDGLVVLEYSWHSDKWKE